MKDFRVRYVYNLKGCLIEMTAFFLLQKFNKRIPPDFLHPHFNVPLMIIFAINLYIKNILFYIQQ